VNPTECLPLIRGRNGNRPWLPRKVWNFTALVTCLLCGGNGGVLCRVLLWK